MGHLHFGGIFVDPSARNKIPPLSLCGDLGEMISVSAPNQRTRCISDLAPALPSFDQNQQA
jgi:hypothetical protein